MPAAGRISLDAAKKDKLFYLVANVVIVRDDGRCLLLRRSEREAVHPGKWCMPGGKLEWGDLDLANPTRMNGDVIDFEDAVEDLLVREAKEESGVDIGRDLAYVNSVAFIRPDGVPVLLVKFAARYLGGAVALEKGSFTDHAWVTAEESRTMDCIEGIPEELVRASASFAAARETAPA